VRHATTATKPQRESKRDSGVFSTGRVVETGADIDRPVCDEVPRFAFLHF